MGYTIYAVSNGKNFKSLFFDRKDAEANTSDTTTGEWNQIIELDVFGSPAPSAELREAVVPKITESGIWCGACGYSVADEPGKTNVVDRYCRECGTKVNTLFSLWPQSAASKAALRKE